MLNVFHAAAMLVGFIVVAVEGIGDITATEEASQLATTGTAHARRIQGGILADGACLTLPLDLIIAWSNPCALGPALVQQWPTLRSCLLHFCITDNAICIPRGSCLTSLCSSWLAGCNSFLGAIAQTLPSTTFAQVSPACLPQTGTLPL